VIYLLSSSTSAAIIKSTRRPQSELAHVTML